MQIPGYKKIAKYTLAFGSVHGLNLLISVIRNKLVSWLLGPEGMGLISIYQSALTLMQNSTNLGLSQSGIRTISIAYDSGDEQEVREQIRLIRSLSMLTAMLGVMACMVLSNVLSRSAFGECTHGMDFVLLSPFVAMMAITGGELAVMKAVRMLKAVAKLSVITALTTLAISTPLYYIYGIGGIIPSLLLTTMAQMLITIGYSYRMYPLQLSFRRNYLAGGKSIVSLGMAFVLAGIFGSGAEFMIRAFLNNNGGTDIVGLYNAGYMMAMTYAGMAFAAFEAEYFPRLSAVCNNDDKREMNETVNRQILVSLIIVGPMLCVLIALLPYVLPLLFSHRFDSVVPMAQIALTGMFVRAIMLPLEYIPLAKGDSGSYLALELIYDVMVVACVCSCYTQWGLTGTGMALVGANLIALTCDVVYLRCRYQVRVSSLSWIIFIVMCAAGALTLKTVMA